MNWLDVIILGIIILFIIRGWKKGLFQEIFTLGGIIGGIIVALNKYETLGKVISNELDFISLKMGKIISFTFIFIGIALFCTIAGALIHKWSQHSLAKGLDRGGGLLLGLFEGSIICSLILVFLININVSPFSEKLSKWTEKSTLSPYLMEGGPFIYDKIVSLVPGETKKFMEKLSKMGEFSQEDSKNK